MIDVAEAAGADAAKLQSPSSRAGGHLRTGTRRLRRSEPTRVAYLISAYPAVSHTFILREVLALRELGIEIETASINAGAPHEKLTQAEQAEAARTYYIKKQGCSGVFQAIIALLLRKPLGLLRGVGTALSLGGASPVRTLLCLFYLMEAAILVRWMRGQKLSHLHVHFASQAATVALLATYLAPVALSITVHGPDEFYDVPGSFLREKMARARFVLCISSFAQSQLMKVSESSDWEKFNVVRLGVDTSHFSPGAFRAQPSCFEILCVGRLVPAKGQRILIEAIALLIGGGRNVHLTLIGGGPDRQGLEQLIGEHGLSQHITLTGAINQDHIRTFYTAADIFALPSFAEGIPVVLMEAMATEIPCVATTINGIPELIQDGRDGLLVAPSDVAGMAGAIARLMDDPGLRLAVGAAGRARVQQAYELGANTERLAEVFRTQLAPACPRKIK